MGRIKRQALILAISVLVFIFAVPSLIAERTKEFESLLKWYQKQYDFSRFMSIYADTTNDSIHIAYSDSSGAVDTVNTTFQAYVATHGKGFWDTLSTDSSIAYIVNSDTLLIADSSGYWHFRSISMMNLDSLTVNNYLRVGNKAYKGFNGYGLTKGSSNDVVAVDSSTLNNQYYELGDIDESSIDTNSSGQLYVKSIGNGDLHVNGILEASNTLNQWNFVKDFDIYNLRVPDPTVTKPESLVAIIPKEFWKNNDSATYANVWLHPSILYVPNSYPRGIDSAHPYLMAMTPYSYTAAETPCFYISDDGIHFREYTNGTDTLHNPLKRVGDQTMIDQYGVDRATSYLSDVNLTYTLGDSIALIYRASGGGGFDSATAVSIWLALTKDLIHWEDSIEIIGPDSLDPILAPTVETINNSKYVMFSVSNYDSTGNAQPYNPDRHYFIIKREATNMRGPWSVKDTMVLYPPLPYADDGDTVRQQPWHLGSRLLSPTQIIFGIKATGATYLGKWTYPSDTIFVDTIPILPKETPSYKPDILLIEGRDGGLSMNIYAPRGQGNTTAEWMYKAYRADSTHRVVIDFDRKAILKDTTTGGGSYTYNVWNNVFNSIVLYRNYMYLDSTNEVTQYLQATAPEPFHPESLYITWRATDSAQSGYTGLRDIKLYFSDTAGASDSMINNVPINKRWEKYYTVPTTGRGTNVIQRTAYSIGDSTNPTLRQYYTYGGEHIGIDIKSYLNGHYADFIVSNIQVVGRSSWYKKRYRDYIQPSKHGAYK